MSKLTVKGVDLHEFLDYLDESAPQKHGVDVEDIRDPDPERLGSGEVISVVLSGIVSVLSTLLLTYLSRRNQNEISFEIENSENKSMSVTLKNLSVDEVKHLMHEFSGDL